MTGDDTVEVTLPANFGQLFSHTGDVLESGETGHVTKREAAIYDLKAKAAEAPGDEEEVARLQALAEEHDVNTNARTVSGLTAALEKAGVEVE